ncbi:hypothetical protein [Aquabacterium sp.]|uniref:hypothetical protein n=1 Tax=Aquabacterium sp. TaxID=1872578 RepID=UPI00345E04CD
MTHIIFYEKPGCGGNVRQRAMLEAAGHTLERRSLLDESWTAASLMAFLSSLPVARWFNGAAASAEVAAQRMPCKSAEN